MLATTPDNFKEFMEGHFKCKVRRFIFSKDFKSQVNFNTFRDYIQTKLPPSIRDKLMNDLLLSHSGKKYNRQPIQRILQIFLSEKTKELQIYPSRYFSSPNFILKFFGRYFNYFNEIVKIINKFKPNLTYLEFYDEFLTFSDLKSILDYTPELKSLKIRIVYYPVGLIEFIVNSCPLLEELVIIGDFANFTVDNLCPHEHLRSLSLRQIKKSSKGFGYKRNLDKILKYFPNLENLLISFRFEITFPLEVPKNLKAFQIFFRNNLEFIEKIHKIFPKITRFPLHFPEYEAVNFISNFKYLNSLDISIKRSKVLRQLLRICGPQLTQIHLLISKVNLTLLLEMCPNLESLYLNWKKNLLVERRYVEDMIFVEERDIIHEKLKKFHFSCEPMFNPKRFLLRFKTIPIESLSFNYLDLGDDDLEELIPVWRNLKNLRIPHAKRISLNGLKRIIESGDKLEEILIPCHLNVNEIEINLNQRNVDLNLLDLKYNEFYFYVNLDHGVFRDICTTQH